MGSLGSLGSMGSLGPAGARKLRLRSQCSHHSYSSHYSHRTPTSDSPLYEKGWAMQPIPRITNLCRLVSLLQDMHGYRAAAEYARLAERIDTQVYAVALDGAAGIACDCEPIFLDIEP